MMVQKVLFVLLLVAGAGAFVSPAHRRARPGVVKAEASAIVGVGLGVEAGIIYFLLATKIDANFQDMEAKVTEMNAQLDDMNKKLDTSLKIIEDLKLLLLARGISFPETLPDYDEPPQSLLPPESNSRHKP